MIISNTERALSIALEHTAWAADEGMSADEVLGTIGMARKPHEPYATWPEVVDALVDAWRDLP